MILSDGTIRQLISNGTINIDPFEPENIQPSSLDVRLGDTFQIFHTHSKTHIDVFEDQTDMMESVHAPEQFVLHPGDFVLGSTKEIVHLPRNVVARLEGKSSLGRLGLAIHATAGFIDAGFQGEITLELSNFAQLPIVLHPDMKIGQLAFFHLDKDVETPYGSAELNSKYQNQRGPTASQYHLNR